MLDFYYAERLPEPIPAAPEHTLEERLKSVELPSSYLGVRRFAELSLIVATLPITLPLIAIIAIGIAIDSRGPILFRQERRGKQGVPFMMLKFRSMYSVDKAGSLLTEHDDPRVTPFGRFIRRHHLDELPQLWNVLIGEMSLIGPRPEPASLSECYDHALPLYPYRRVMVPGLTGLAQVEHGYTAEIDDTRIKLEYDLHYILHLSLRLDLIVLLRTLRVVITGAGAR